MKKEYASVMFETMKYQSSLLTDVDYDKLDDIKKLINRIDYLEDRPFFILDYYKQNFFFISEKFNNLFGHTGETKHDFNFFIDHLHPDDFKINNRGPIEFLNIVNELKNSEIMDYLMIGDYRLKMPSGSYVRILEKSCILKTDKSWHPWLMLAISDLAENQDLSLPCSVKIINTRTNEFVFTLGDQKTIENDKMLTSREKEILSLIAKGYSSKLIAGKLGISINTVNNHRRNILIKTGCANTFESLKYILKYKQ